MAKRKVTPLGELVQAMAPVVPKYLQTGCVPFDLMTMGKGLRLGSVWQIASASGWGKSSSLLHVSKCLANTGHKTLYAAAEDSSSLVAAMGLTSPEYVDKVLVAPCVTYTDLENLTYSFLESDFTLMVIDSLTAVVPSKFLAADTGLEDHLVGTIARIRGTYLQIMSGLIQKLDKTIIFVSQMRANFSAGWGGEEDKAEGGYATEFYSSVRAVFKNDSAVSDLTSGEDKHIIGRQGYLGFLKNREGSPKARIPVQIIFGIGVNSCYTLIHFLTWAGYIEGSGAWFTMGVPGLPEERIQGKMGRQMWVKDHIADILPAFYDRAAEYYDWLTTPAHVDSIKV